MLILKENAANSVPTPPVGKDTFFIDDSGVPSIKNSDGNVTTFPTVNASNAQVVFMNGSALSGEAALTYDFNNNILNITGNLAAGNVKTDNLLYANGTPWDLQQPGGSNTQIQFNDADSFGGSAAFTFNKSSNLVSMGGALSVTGNANVGNLGTAQVLVTANVTAPQLISNVSTGTAPLVVSSTTRVANLDVAKAGIANTVNDAAQPNITSVGTLTSLSVTGNASAGNISTGGVLSVTGNANVGNLGTGGLIVATGNVTGGNLVTAGALSVTGNGNLGNVGAAAGVFTANVSAGNLSTGGELSVSGNAVISGNLTVDGNLVYVNVETLAVEDPIIQLQTGPNGAAPSSNSGKDVGSALNYYDSQARVAFMGWDVSNAEFGLASQSTIANEVVTFSTYGNLRAGVYFGNAAGLTNIPGGNIVGNISGNISNAAHAVTSNTVVDAAQPNITSVGTLTSVAVTGNASAGNFNTAGKVVASTFESNVSTGTAPLVVASTTKVTNLNADLLDGYSTDTAATANTIVVRNADGNITGNNISGTLSTASQPSITSVGTLTSLVVSGSANTGAINPTGHIIPTADETYDLGNATNRFRDLWISGNSIRIGNSQIKSNATSLVLQNPDGGQVVVSGNSISSSTTIVNGNSNVNIPSANGNVNISATGTANVVVVTSTGVNVAGTLNATGNANVGNLGTGGLITATGNVSGGNLTTAGKVVASTLESNVATGTAPFTVASTTKVTNLNADLLDGYSTATAATANTVVIRDADGSFSANVVTATLSGAATTAGTVTTNAQPNITSVGTLSSLAVTGNGTFGNVYANSGIIGAQTLIGEGGNISNVTAGNITGQVANALVSGTVYTNAQPNITSVGTLSSLAVTGNATAGNVYANAGTIGAANLTGTLTTAAQPNITSLGTLTGLGVNGNITAANITANTGVFTGNGSGLSALAGANVTGQVANALLAGTVYTNAQPNITSVGTLTSLAVTGNATAGNVYANAGTIGAANLTGTLTTAAQPNITSVGTLSSLTATGNVTGGNLVTTGILSVTGTGTSSIAGNLDMTGNTISNLATPSASTDAATKQYVDDVAQGLNIHDSCAAATPDTLANITGGTITYNNGTAGVGAYLTTSGTFNLIDGVNVQTSGTRILVKNEANAVLNGIYTYTNTTAITRAVDFDSVPEVEAGDFTFVTGGTLYDNTGWVQTDSPTGIGTAGNNISFTQFSGAGTYQAGTGLTLLGSTFSVNASQTQVTSVGTLTGLNVNGTVTASAFTANTGIFTGNGAGLSQLAGGNVTGQVANALVAGTVYTASQPNITSVGTLTSLAVTGNITAGNVTGANLVSANFVTGTLTTAAQPNITSVGTLTSLTVTGNASAGNLNTAGKVVASTLESNVATGTAPFAVASTTRVANLNVAYANVADNINVTTQSSGNAYLIFANALTGNVAETANAAFVANTSNGALYATTFIGAVSGNGAALTDLNASNISSGTLAQARLANSTLTLGNTTLTLGATTTTVAGLTNITSTQLTSNVATGTAPLVVTSTTRVANLNVATAGVANTVNDAAQPNITSVGTLTSLAVTGNASAGNLNTAGKVVASTLESNVATGTAPFVVASTTTVANLAAATATTAGTVTTAAQPNITSLGTLTGLGVNGNITAANITANTGVFTGNGSGLSALAGANVTGTVSSATTAGTVTTAAQPNITSVGTLTSVSSSGNIVAPNVQANTGFFISSINAAVSAAGTAQGNATALTREINVTSTVASGAGVALPAAVAGMRVTIINTAANAVLVYPASGGTINSLALNAAFSQAAGARLDFIATTGTQWYTLNATYL